MIDGKDKNNKKEYEILFAGVNLSYELYTLEYIWDELNNNKQLFGPLEKIESVTRSKIREYGKKLNEHSRHYAYIKFCYDQEDKKCYGLVGGKSNYTYPDLSFDELNNQSKPDNRYARNFLSQQEKKWAETIIIVNHKPSSSEEKDKQAAFFLECYLQRKFNLFDS